MSDDERPSSNTPEDTAEVARALERQLQNTPEDQRALEDSPELDRSPVAEGADAPARAPATRADDAPATSGHNPGWQQRFLRTLALMPNVRAACEMAEVSRSTVYKARSNDEHFAAAWDTAVQEAVDRLEAACWQRATVGHDRVSRVYNKDGSLARESVETVFSDRLAELMLKAHRPERYVIERKGDDDDDKTVDRAIAELANELGIRAGAEEVPAE